MRRSIKMMGYIFLFVGALLFLLPKDQLYFLAERKMSSMGFVIDGESVRDEGMSVALERGSVTHDSREYARLEHADIWMYAFYNRIELRGMKLSATYARLLPSSVTQVVATHAFWDPLHIQIRAAGDFGEADARVSILDRNGTVLLHPSKLMLNRYAVTLRRLKHEAKGYRYDFHF